MDRIRALCRPMKELPPYDGVPDFYRIFFPQPPQPLVPVLNRLAEGRTFESIPVWDRPRRPGESSSRAYACAALADEVRNVAYAVEGTRNHTLNTAAFSLGQLVGGGELPRGQVEEELTRAAEATGLPLWEINKTLRSGLDAGSKQPRRAPLPTPWVAPTVTTLGDHDTRTGEPQVMQEVNATDALSRVHDAYLSWLGQEYDLDVLDVVLAVAASEQLSGDPAWLLVVGGSGAAKTETLLPLGGAGTHVTSTISSEGALLSGTAQKERAKAATGGLLRKIGTTGLLVIKDVTSILSMNRDSRGTVLAALREVYDGRWERNLGTDGGRTLTWAGRIVVIGAVTTSWDKAHAVIAAMGDRFLLVRLDTTTGRAQAGRQAMRNTGEEVQMRTEQRRSSPLCCPPLTPPRTRASMTQRWTNCSRWPMWSPWRARPWSTTTEAM